MKNKKKILAKISSLFSLDACRRYDAHYHALNRLVKTFGGFRMYELYVTWFKDEEFLRVWSESKFHDGHPENIGAKKFELYQFAKAASIINGDTVECGVGKGAGSYIILKANNNGKIHHIFDSFEGLTKPEPEDQVSSKKVFKWKKHDLSTPESQVRTNLKEFKNVKFYKGWIPERFNEIADKKFSFVHIDVDLYKPTIDSLTFFFPLMYIGGIIICDDYGFATCPGVKKACDEFFKDKDEKIIHLSSGHALIIKIK